MPIALAVAAAVLVSTACAMHQPAPAGPALQVGAGTPQPRDLEQFIGRYQTDHSGVARFYDLPWSETQFDRMERVNKEWQDKLAAVDFGGLDQQGKIDTILL